MYRRVSKLISILIIIFLIDTSIVLAVEYNLQYDTNGNLIQGKDKYYEYNTLNQLFRVRENNAEGRILELYAYDADGNRILKIEYGSNGENQTINYVDKNYVQITNYTGTFNEIYYYDDSGLVAERDTNGNLKAVHSDHLGSTNIVTNASGSVIEEDYYEPYGSELQNSNSRYTYTGKEKDTTGLMYYGARNYNTEQGQFIQADKNLPNIYDPQQLNRYSYARNNPYKYIDKEGKSTVPNPFDFASASYNLGLGLNLAKGYLSLSYSTFRQTKYKTSSYYLYRAVDISTEAMWDTIKIATVGMSSSSLNYRSFTELLKEGLPMPTITGTDLDRNMQAIQLYYQSKEKGLEDLKNREKLNTKDVSIERQQLKGESKKNKEKKDFGIISKVVNA